MRIRLERTNRNVPVRLILKKLHDACDKATWGHYEWDDEKSLQALLKHKTKDKQFWALCDIIPEQGFTHPICIQVRGDGTWQLGNGHHRLAAAVLLVLDEINVFFTAGEDYMHDTVTDPTDDYLVPSEWEEPDGICREERQVYRERYDQARKNLHELLWF